MDAFANLFSAFGLASAAGLNAYVPLLTVGLIGRYTDLLALAEPFDILTHPYALIALGVMAVVDFVADKVPAVDTAWHAVGAIANPVAGAVLFASQNNVLTDVHPALAAAAGFIVAGGFHGGRAAARPAATAMTGGTANPVLSFFEDVTAVVMSVAAIFLPVVGFLLFLVLAVVLFVGARRVGRLLRARAAAQAPRTG